MTKRRYLVTVTAVYEMEAVNAALAHRDALKHIKVISPGAGGSNVGPHDKRLVTFSLTKLSQKLTISHPDPRRTKREPNPKR